MCQAGVALVHPHLISLVALKAIYSGAAHPYKMRNSKGLLQVVKLAAAP